MSGRAGPALRVVLERAERQQQDRREGSSRRDDITTEQRHSGTA